MHDSIGRAAGNGARQGQRLRFRFYAQFRTQRPAVNLKLLKSSFGPTETEIELHHLTLSRAAPGVGLGQRQGDFQRGWVMSSRFF
jgi:hypothetical protein